MSIVLGGVSIKHMDVCRVYTRSDGESRLSLPHGGHIQSPELALGLHHQVSQAALAIRCWAHPHTVIEVAQKCSDFARLSAIVFVRLYSLKFWQIRNLTELLTSFFAGICMVGTFGWCNMNSSGPGEDCHCCSCCRNPFYSDPFERQVLDEMARSANPKDAGASAKSAANVADAPVDTQPASWNDMSITPSWSVS